MIQNSPVNTESTLRQLQDFGFTPDPRRRLEYGRICRGHHRDEKHDLSAWCFIRQWTSPKTGKVYDFVHAECFRCSEKIKIEPSGGIAPDDQEIYKSQLKAMQEEEKKAQAELHAEAAKIFEEIWDAAALYGDSAYLEIKGVKIHDIRFDGDVILVPVRKNGKLTGLQRIFPDGKKMHMLGTDKKGGYHLISDGTQNGHIVVIAEGYATAASAHEATCWPTAVAFDCGNLRPVAEAIRKTYPKAKIILAADDDYQTAGNPGLTNAKAAAKAVGGVVAVPKFKDDATRGTDWNDLFIKEGYEVVKAQLLDSIKPTPPPVDFSWLSDTPLEKISWIWPGVIPRGMLSMIGGKQGMGKSFLIADIAARLSCGKPLPDGFSPSKDGIRVLLMPREDPASSVIKPRVMAAGGDESKIGWSLFRHEKGNFLDISKSKNVLVNLIQFYGFEVVFIDTYASFAAVDSDANAAQDVRALLDVLSQAARETGAAIVITAHSRKNEVEGEDPMDAIAGSVQMTAAVRTACLMSWSRNKEGVRWFRCVKSNLGRVNKIGWTWTLEHPEGNIDAMPQVTWTEADLEFVQSESNTRGELVEVDAEKLIKIVTDLVAPKAMTVTQVVNQAWAKLRKEEGQRRIRKTDVNMSIMDMSNPGGYFELGEGSRGANLIALPGQIPETPKMMAYRLARENPNRPYREIMNLAGCRDQVAREALKEAKL